jgi:hypothetical protein
MFSNLQRWGFHISSDVVASEPLCDERSNLLAIGNFFGLMGDCFGGKTPPRNDMKVYGI